MIFSSRYVSAIAALTSRTKRKYHLSTSSSLSTTPLASSVLDSTKAWTASICMGIDSISSRRRMRSGLRREGSIRHCRTIFFASSSNTSRPTSRFVVFRTSSLVSGERLSLDWMRIMSYPRRYRSMISRLTKGDASSMTSRGGLSSSILGDKRSLPSCRSS